MEKLQREILPLQGYKVPGKNAVSIGCKPVESAFPGKVFPTAAIHEFISRSHEQAAATAGFISAIVSHLVRNDGIVVWAGHKGLIFPPALAQFNVDASKIIFVDAKNEKQLLWVTEEALKCNGLSAVISETTRLDFTTSRRFQLAVEQSSVTGFVMHHSNRPAGSNACISRWNITAARSEPDDNLPGVGFPRWKVELLKVRNGTPGNWLIEWSANQFREITGEIVTGEVVQKKAG